MSDTSGSVSEALRTIEKSKIEARRLSGLPTEVPVEKETPAGVSASRYYVKDEVEDRLTTARDAGTVKKDDTRVNILSNFKGRDGLDTYQIEVAEPGALQLDRLGDVSTRVQIIAPDGQMIADSEASQGTRAAGNYAQMRAGTFDAPAGTYFIRALRPEDTGQSEVGYGLQFSQGDFVRDRDVVENNDPYGDDNDRQKEEQIASAFGNVEAFEKNTRDVRDETPSDARDIGRLIQNTSRLNVITELGREDTVDHFTFSVHRTGEARLGLLEDTADKIDVQLTRPDGSVVADSAAEKGSAEREAFDALRRGTQELESGQYIAKIQRSEEGEDAPAEDERVNYSFQLTQGSRYQEDYDTIEKAFASEEQQDRRTAEQALQAYQDTRASTAQRLGSIMLDSAGLREYDATSALYGSDPAGQIFDALRAGSTESVTSTLSKYGYL